MELPEETKENNPEGDKNEEVVEEEGYQLFEVEDDFETLFANIRAGNNSPFAFQNEGSGSISSGSSSSNNSLSKPKRLRVEDVAASMSRYYDDLNKYSNEIDILIAYVRSLRSVYAKALSFTKQSYYGLTVTSLMLTAFVTLATPFLSKYSWNVYAISGMNAVGTLMFSLVTYMELQSQMHSFTYMATAYEKFETSLQLTNNYIAFLPEPQRISDLVLEKIKEIETKINDVRDIGQIALPSLVREYYPISSKINIFAFIKKMETHKRSLLIKFTDLKNEMNMLYHRLSLSSDKTLNSNYQKRLVYLNDLKGPLKEQLIEYHDAYTQLEFLFAKEVQHAESRYLCMYPCYKQSHLPYLQLKLYSNPVILEYLRLLTDTPTLPVDATKENKCQWQEVSCDWPCKAKIEEMHEQL